MNTLLLRRSAISFVIGMLTILSSNYAVADEIYIDASSCSAAGGIYEDGICIGLNYYEPYGTVYGGWGPGYYVGPYRNGGNRRNDNRYRRSGHEGGHSSEHAYRSAPASRPMPSIPSHSRSGSRGGGAHPGGGGSHSGGGSRSH